MNLEEYPNNFFTALEIGETMKVYEGLITLKGASIKRVETSFMYVDDFEPIPLNEDWLVRLGGEKLPYHNILNSIFFKVGRNRIVSVGNVGTPNEMIWLCQVNATNDKIIDDIICLRNYDYDGYTPVHTFQNLIHALTGTELTITDK